jgi:prepilin-type N-terminal cleavage/methylation domain-containing protein
MKIPLNRARTIRAFTLIELLVVIAVIAMLATLLLPVTAKVIDQANASKCQHNLRQLGMLIQTAATDNNGAYPLIENDPKNPIHKEDAGGRVWTLPELVQARGGSLELLKCPADPKAKLAHPKNTNGTSSYYEMFGSSYEWFPFFEGENVNAPRIFTPFGTRNIPPKRVRLLMDYAENGEAPHNRSTAGSSMHVVYADGSVRTVTLTKVQ